MILALTADRKSCRDIKLKKQLFIIDVKLGGRLFVLGHMFTYFFSGYIVKPI